MSDDIATLGLAVDSSQVKTATTALQAFTQAASPAATAAASLTNATQGTSTASAAFAGAVDAGSNSVRAQREAIRAFSGDLAIFGGSLGQVVGTVGILALENSRLAEGFGGIKNMLASVITPTTALVGGFIAVAGGAALAYDEIIKNAQAYDNLSQHTNTAVQALQGLDTSAAGKGIADSDFLTSMEKFGTLAGQAKDNIGSLAELFHANGDAAGTMVQDLAQVADLVANTNNTQKQYQIIQAAGLPTTQAWLSYLSQGGDAIRAAASANNNLGSTQQMLVDKARDLNNTISGTWKQWENEGTSALLTVAGKLDDLSNSSFFGAIKTAAMFAGSIALGGVGMSSLMSNTFGGTSPNKTVSSGFSSLNSSYSNPALAVGLNAAAGHGGGRPPRTKEDAENDLNQSSSYISLLGQQASVTDAVTAKQNELDRAYLDSGVSLGSAAQKVLAYTQSEALGTLQMQQQTDTLNTQTQAIGMGVGATAAFTAEQTKLNEFAERGITLTAQQTEQIHAYAQALGVATQAAAVTKLQSDTNFSTSQLGRSDTDQNVATAMRSLYGNDYVNQMNSALAGQIRMNDLLGQTKNAAGSAFSTFLQDLASGKSGTVALSDALTSLENKLFDIIGNQAASALFKGGTSIFSGIFGSTPTSAPGAPLNILPTNHTGYGPGDMQTTFRTVSGSMLNWPRHHDGIGPGEHGAVVRNDESILTPGQMRQLAPASRAGNGGGGTQVNVNNYSGQQIQQTKRTDSNGLDIVDIMVGSANRAMAKGDFDSSLRSRPGGRQPIARR